MKIEYIDNDKTKGILYDYDFLRKEFKKLKVPKTVYTPTHLKFEKYKWFVEMSQRGMGKTTNFILFGMLMNKYYGTIIHYVRDTEKMITPKNMQDILSVIFKFGYIEKLTEGKYNSAIYKARRWYYCKRDDEGNVIEKSENHFMFCCSVDESFLLKSSYQCDVADFIIFDEFISKYNYSNEFVEFIDLLSTLIRKRWSPIIVLSANTIDIEHNFFYELGIAEIIHFMEMGTIEEVTTEKGTRISIEYIGDKVPEETSKHNKLFFGFNNSKLNSITGESWATFNYPHIWKKANSDIIFNNIYIYHNNKYLRLDIVSTDKFDICIFCHKATITYDDSIIYTIEELKDERYKDFKNDDSQITTLLKDLIKKRLIFFDNNSSGNLYENFLKMVR